MNDRAATPGRGYSRWDPRRPLTRLALAVLAGELTVWAVAPLPWAVRIVAAWDVLSVTELLLAFSIIASSGPEATRRRAGAREPGRVIASVIVEAASAVSLFAAIYLLRHASQYGRLARTVLVVLCIAAVAFAWVLTHMTYSARYARLYFRESGGLRFPSEEPPVYWDFVYFAFTIGMCFQVSDVDIVARRMRRTALGHALLSFAYNTAVLALALNLVAGL